MRRMMKGMKSGKRSILRRGAAGFLPCAVLLLGAWGAQAGEKPTSEQQASSQIKQRFENVESQVTHLEQLENNLRREIDSIEATRKDLTAQLSNLKSEVAEARRLAPGGSGAEAPAPKTHWFLRLISLVVVVGAIFFLARLFFARWGGEDEPGSGPTIVKTNDPETIRARAQADAPAETADSSNAKSESAEEKQEKKG